MKQGWTYKPLGEVCDLYQPQTISKKDMVTNGKYNVFGANGIIGKYDKYNHELPEILMTCRGATCGNINVSTPKSWINGNAMVVHIKDESVINRLFLTYILSYIDKSKIITGAAQPQITRQTLYPLEICYPNLYKQERIVEYLDKAFEDIDTLKNNAQKQLDDARKLFQAALTEAMQPKDGWEQNIFGNACSYYKEQGKYEDIKYIGMEHIESGTGKLKGYESSNSILSNSFKFSKGDVLYGRLRPYLRKVYIADFDGCCSTEIFPIRSKVVEPRFIKYWLLSDDISNKINATSAGCRMPRGNMNEVKKFRFFYPFDKKAQIKLVERLDALSDNVQKLEEINRKVIAECDALKQSILRQIFE